jgi:hypothetical protein
MISIEQLHIAEQQIESLLTHNESNWKAIASGTHSRSPRLPEVVQQRELFKQKD